MRERARRMKQRSYYHCLIRLVRKMNARERKEALQIAPRQIKRAVTEKMKLRVQHKDSKVGMRWAAEGDEQGL